MRILLINQFYYPDVAATAQQLSDLGEHLVEAGHEVTVLCSRGQYDDGSGRPTPRRETHRGVRIRRLSAPSFGKSSTLGRMADYAGFHLLCGLRTLAAGWRYDVAVTLTTPPLIGIYATLLRWITFGRTRHVCWAMDLHPDCEFELGVLKRGGVLGRALEWLNATHFRAAHATVALGGCMEQRLLDKGVAPERLHVIGVWNRADRITPMPTGESPLRADHGLEDKFIVMYSGNAGLIHTFDAVCEAMRRLRDDRRIVFLFIGGGKRLSEVAGYAAEHQLANFTRLPYFPRERLNESLAMGDVHLITLRPEMAGVAVPCKTYGIMAAGRPAIFVGPNDADTARHLRDADAGLVIAPDNPGALVDAIRHLADDDAYRQRLGANARTAFEARHEREVCCEQWRELLEGLT